MYYIVKWGEDLTLHDCKESAIDYIELQCRNLGYPPPSEEFEENCPSDIDIFYAGYYYEQTIYIYRLPLHRNL